MPDIKYLLRCTLLNILQIKDEDALTPYITSNDIELDIQTILVMQNNIHVFSKILYEDDLSVRNYEEFSRRYNSDNGIAERLSGVSFFFSKPGVIQAINTKYFINPDFSYKNNKELVEKITRIRDYKEKLILLINIFDKYILRKAYNVYIADRQNKCKINPYNVFNLNELNSNSDLEFQPN